MYVFEKCSKLGYYNDGYFSNCTDGGIMDSDMKCPNCGGMLFVLQRTQAHCVRCHEIIPMSDVSKIIAAQDYEEAA